MPDDDSVSDEQMVSVVMGECSDCGEVEDPLQMSGVVVCPLCGTCVEECWEERRPESRLILSNLIAQEYLDTTPR